MKQDELILKYQLKYPEFSNTEYYDFIERVNVYYATRNSLFIRFDIQELYRLGLEDYKYAKENDIPFRNYEVYTDFTVAYNRECLLSTFTDIYKYTGGAHGSTERISTLWNLSLGKNLNLSDLFIYPNQYESYITDIIINYIEEDIKAGNDIYFEDYKTNVVDRFNPMNFYISEDGIVIYFQQYDIAPYSSGILTFLIPFEEGIMELPEC